MEFEEYKEYLVDNSLSEEASLIFEYFEPLTDEFFKIEKPFDNRNETIPYFRKINESIQLTSPRGSELSRAISTLSQKMKDNDLGRSISYSLYQNYNQFIKMNKTVSNIYIRKWIKLLCSAHAATRFVPLQIALMHNSRTKLLLATGIVKESEDPKVAASVKEEVDYIWCKSFHDKKTLVVPFISCTFYLFQRLMTSKKFTSVHIAGHGSNTHLRFFDKNIDYSEFVNCFVNDMDFSLLNCCCTYDFIGCQRIPGNNITIAHRGEVPDGLAREFTQDFYVEIWRDKKDIITAANKCINKANSKEMGSQAYFLLQ